ncbi:hypothetical protein [Paenibacillus xylaniclasticus]|uniref:hypothetical protein n=1 Tax=Paenibacillus xylaniclasticus TaxID=588083 RepID=UPI000FDA672A|nr:hypothetical protein [Paenibacillus xylaniclasticus]GFN32549.1 hypothetical protein PCURB6_28090 [Paenibacillus curdlanolyticus]
MKKYKNITTGAVVVAEECNDSQVFMQVKGFGSAVDKQWFYENYKPVSKGHVLNAHMIQE